MIAPVFVDTNVLVYAYQAAEPAKQQVAAHWLENLWREQVGRVSVQVLNELYVTLSRKIKPALSAEEAWDTAQSLLAWSPAPMEGALLQRARDIETHHKLSWWDCLIVAAAQVQNCALLLTEDLQEHVVYSGVTVRNPFRLSVAEAAATYRVNPELSRSRRSRGRPKRVISQPA